MYYIVTQETIDQMMQSPGEVRGEVLKKDEEFILRKGGEEKLKMVEEEIEEMGHAFAYKAIKKGDYYPWGRRILSLLAISRAFNMDKEKVEQMGRSAVEESFLMRFIIGKFFTVNSIFKKNMFTWRRNHTVGRLEIVKIDREQKKAIVRLYNLNFHPIFCDYLCGYFAAIAEIAEGKKVSCKEEKCFFKGESFFHEFLLAW